MQPGYHNIVALDCNSLSLRLQIRFFACITSPTARQMWTVVLPTQILQQALYSWQVRLRVTRVAKIHSDVQMKHPFAAHPVRWQW